MSCRLLDHVTTGRHRLYNMMLIITLLIIATRHGVRAQAPSDGLYFTLYDNVYLPGATIPITDVGDGFPGTTNPTDPGPSLVCNTSNVNTMCCRGSDHPGSDSVGDWLYPNGTIVLGNNANPNGEFTRTSHTQQIRLNRKRAGVMSPTGVYTCEVPDEVNTTMIHTATITLSDPPTTQPTIPPTTTPPTTAPPTTTPPTTTPPTTAPPTTTPPTTTPPTTAPPTTTPPTTTPPTTAPPTTTPPTTTPPTTQFPSSDLFFLLGPREVLYNNGDAVFLSSLDTDLLAGPLVCVTTNVNTQCCRSEDINGGMGIGEWYHDNTVLLNNQSSPGLNLYRNRDRERVNLHVRDGMIPHGLYRCDVLDDNGDNVSATLTLTNDPVTSTGAPDTTTTITTTINVNQGSGNSSAGVAVGVVIVILVLGIAVVLFVLFLVFFWRRNKMKKPSLPESVHLSSIRKAPPPRPAPFKNNANGHAQSSTAPLIEEFPEDTRAIEGEGVYFKVVVSGCPSPQLSWYFKKQRLTTDYSREVGPKGDLTFHSCESGQSGVYTIMAENSTGKVERKVKLSVHAEGKQSAINVGGAKKREALPAVLVEEFGRYVQRLHGNSNQLMREQYKSLDGGEEGQAVSVSLSPENHLSNRFGNIIVYDDNRVVLETSSHKDCHNDYINASYVDGYSIPNKFIATQGPLPKTVVDFWRMVWQERPPTIVMVTNLKEGTKIKCQEYWPASGKKEVGPFIITITDQQIFADYTIRTFNIESNAERPFKVRQYHFTEWPDHGVPDYATPLLTFYKRVMTEHYKSKGPIVIHCSAGVGRTGTFIAIDNILEQIKKKKVVDVGGVIEKMRTKRMKMVQTEDQYGFIHDGILEYLTCGDTQILTTDLRVKISMLSKTPRDTGISEFTKQFKVLEQVSPKPEELNCKTALRHAPLNRGPDFLPGDRWRVILKGEQPDYINAVTVNGYKHQRAFIIAQTPLPTTVRNFWKIIYDRKIATIIQLTGLEEEGQEACAQYWPVEGEMDVNGDYIVELMEDEELLGFNIRKFSVMEVKSANAREVTQFHITCWNGDGTCSNLKSIIDTIEEMTKIQRRTGNKPIVVTCTDTVTRSGMFCAVATTIERCKTEGIVDIFQVVKALRVQKPGAVCTVEQYVTIFEALLVFLDSFDNYANFL